MKMNAERYLKVFLFTSDLAPNLRETILLKLEEKYLNKGVQGVMILNLELKDPNNITLSRTTTINIGFFVLVKVSYNLYKPGDIIIGDLFFQKPSIVLSNDKIFEFQNSDLLMKCDTKRNVIVQLLGLKHTSGCPYFLAECNLIQRYTFFFIYITSLIIENR